MKHVAAALLTVLVLSWMGPAFGAGAVAGAGHGMAYDSASWMEEGGSSDHGDDHHHPGHALDEHSSLGHLLDHLSGTLFNVSLVEFAPVNSGSVRCPSHMPLLTATLSPLYRPPIVSVSA